MTSMSPEGLGQAARDDEVLSFTEEALALAERAVKFDVAGNLYEACSAYDKTLLTLDEVLIATPLGSEQWKMAADLRDVYNNRLLEIKKSHENENSFSFLNGRGGPSVSDARAIDDHVIDDYPSPQEFNSHNQQQLFEPLQPAELRAFENTFEPAPQSMLLVPYWQLRALRSSILHGGYLTRGLLLPRAMWEQHDVKMSGVSTKVSAFNAMNAVLLTHLSTIKEPCSSVKRVVFEPNPTYADDSGQSSPSSPSSGSTNTNTKKTCKYVFSREDVTNMSLEAVHSFSIALTGIRQELGEIQNTLSRSFRFIPELEMSELRSVRSSDTDVQPVRRESDLFRGVNNSDAASGDYSSNSYNKDIDSNSGNIGNSIADFGMSFFGAAARGMERASSMVSSGANTVKKAAEIGISRIGVMQAKVPRRDLVWYTSTVVKLAEQCQELHSWYEYYDVARAALLELDSAHSSPSSPTKHNAENAADAAAAKERHDQEVVRSHLVSMVEGALTSLLHITRIIKEAICEPLVRDAEVLHTSHMASMARSLVALDWEQ